MADVPKRLAFELVGSSADDLYGPAPSGGVIVRSMNFVNVTTDVVYLWVSVGATGVDTDASRILHNAQVLPGDPITWNGWMFVPSGEYIVAKCDVADGVTAYISGVEQ